MQGKVQISLRSEARARLKTSAEGVIATRYFFSNDFNQKGVNPKQKGWRSLMSKWISMLLVFLALPALAKENAYDIKMEVALNGRVISSPRVVTKIGETATITEKNGFFENFFEVTATEGEIESRKGIRMKVVIGVVGADGRRNVISTPELLAYENEKAEIKVGGLQKEELSLSVLAKRVSL